MRLHLGLALLSQIIGQDSSLGILQQRESGIYACLREREIHYVISASPAYEDGIMFMSEPFAARQ